MALAVKALDIVDPGVLLMLCLSCDGDVAGAGGGSPRRSRRLKGSLQQRHFYEEADPDRALAMLEAEMSLDMEERPRAPAGSRTDASMRAARGLGKLQALLEQECEAQVGPGCAAAALCHHEHLDDNF